MEMFSQIWAEIQAFWAMTTWLDQLLLLWTLIGPPFVVAADRRAMPNED